MRRLSTILLLLACAGTAAGAELTLHVSATILSRCGTVASSVSCDRETEELGYRVRRDGELLTLEF